MSARVVRFFSFLDLSSRGLNLNFLDLSSRGLSSLQLFSLLGNIGFYACLQHIVYRCPRLLGSRLLLSRFDLSGSFLSLRVWSLFRFAKQSSILGLHNNFTTFSICAHKNLCFLIAANGNAALEALEKHQTQPKGACNL